MAPAVQPRRRLLRSVLAVAAVVSAATVGSAESPASAAYLGKIYYPDLSGTPEPYAFFPLTEGSGETVSSWPHPDYNGTLNSTTGWEDDEVFGRVLRCTREEEDVVIIDPVDYGSTGPFSVNLWFRANRSDLEGATFEYLFSNSANATIVAPASVDTFYPNQVSVYLPEREHPAHGLVRAVVKDSSDQDTQSFLDSDGQLTSNLNRTAPPATGAVDDGAWHMVTITSRPDNTSGFDMYTDGKLAASMPPPNGPGLPADGSEVDGGQPLAGLGQGAIYLCARSDLNASRFFTGSVSHLSIWNEALAASEVAALWGLNAASVRPQSWASAPTAPAPTVAATAPATQDFSGTADSFADAAQAPHESVVAATSGLVASSPMANALEPRLTDTGARCQFPFTFNGAQQFSCVSMDGRPGAPTYCVDDGNHLARCSDELSTRFATFQAYVDQYTPSGALELDSAGHARLCALNGSAVPETGGVGCGAGYACGPLTRAQRSAGDSASAARLTAPALGPGVGVCAWGQGVFLPVGPGMPAPSGYFPLVDYNPAAWPIPHLWFQNASAASSNETSWVPDDRFGTVVHCAANAQQALVVRDVEFGTKGPFAMNLWMRQDSNTGDFFQFLISGRSNANGPLTDQTSVFSANNVHVYLPDSASGARNLVRAVVKDSTDTAQGSTAQTWLDSDGKIGTNEPRDSVPSGDLIGKWHMVTITTIPGGGKGYQLYVDGWPAAQLTVPQDFFHVDGGAPMEGIRELVLCGRSDFHEARFFDGRLTQFAVFDTALTPQQVSNLFYNVKGYFPVPTAAAAAAAAKAGIGLEQPSPAAAAFAASPGALEPFAGGPSLAAILSSDVLPLVVEFAPSAGAPLATVATALVPNPAAYAAGPHAARHATAPEVDADAATESSRGHIRMARAVHTLPIAAVVSIIVVAAVILLAVAAMVALLVTRRRRSWQKADLDNEAPMSPPGPRPAPDPRPLAPAKEAKAPLFSGAPSHSIQVHAHAAP